MNGKVLLTVLTVAFLIVLTALIFQLVNGGPLGHDDSSNDDTAIHNVTANISSSSTSIEEHQEEHGFWGEADAAVEWCEENYAVVPWIAEFFNTLSCIWFVLFGAQMMLSPIRLRRKNNARVGEYRFVLNGLWTLTTGLGSIAFHGTMRRREQLWDEMPMCWLMLNGCWIQAEMFNLAGLTAEEKVSVEAAHPGTIVEPEATEDSSNSSTSNRFKFRIHPAVMCIVAVALTVVNAALDDTIATIVFYLSFTPFFLTWVARSIQHYIQAEQGSEVRHMHAFSFVCIAVGLVFWSLDNMACVWLRSLPVNPQFHAFWHFWMALAAYLTNTAEMLVRLNFLGHEKFYSVPRFLWILPIVVPKEPTTVASDAVTIEGDSTQSGVVDHDNSSDCLEVQQDGLGATVIFVPAETSTTLEKEEPQLIGVVCTPPHENEEMISYQHQQLQLDEEEDETQYHFYSGGMPQLLSDDFSSSDDQQHNGLHRQRRRGTESGATTVTNSTRSSSLASSAAVTPRPSTLVPNPLAQTCSSSSSGNFKAAWAE